MAESDKHKEAQVVYRTLCDALDARKWRFERYDDDMVIHFTVSGDDIPMEFLMGVDADRELITVYSRLPFVFPEDKRLEGAIATGYANYKMVDGNFDYNYADGSTSFKMTCTFTGSLISGELLDEMVQYAACALDDYNEKFMMVARGYWTIDQFINDKD